MAKKNAKGGGTIRKKAVTRSGKEYTYWEARLTVGRDPGTGKQIQRSFTGKTQKEVREKMQAAAVEVNQGTYTAPQRLTVGQWLDIWQRDYLGAVKPATLSSYKSQIKNHIKPALGAVRLVDLHPHTVQQCINGLDRYAPSTVRQAYKVLHNALEKAVELDYIPRNPATKCTLPRQEQEEIKPFDDQEVAVLLEIVKGGRLEYIVPVALFTGMRMSELLGLTWDCVDFGKGTVTVNKQLARPEHRKAGLFITPKSGKARTITPAASVFSVLKAQRRKQMENQLRAGPIWDNPHGLIFTTETGRPLCQHSVTDWFSAATAAVGIEGARFHNCRHTYAVNAIRAGDNIKAIQGNLGHATAAFTLDRYAHFTDQLQKDSAARMEGFIKSVLNL